MRRTRTIFPALVVAALAALAVPALAGNVGSTLPPPELEDFAQTPAKSFDDYMGRTVLIEFFAYW